MKLYIFHRTSYSYPSPVRQSYNELRLHPLSNDWQHCSSSTITILPICKLQSYLDLNGNIVHYFELPEEHQKLVIESRAFAMTGHYEDAIKSLDRLIPIIESDPRDVDSICQYLEASRDIKGLCHLLEYFSNKPIHAKYALSRLIQYRAGSAHSHELVVWLEKLAELSPQDITLQVAILYLNLLDTQLISPSTKLNGLIENAEELVEKIINLTNPEDIVSSFDWEIILNNRESFKSKYGILIDKENQLFESKAMSNLDEKLMFMVEKEIFYSRNFDLPLERCVVWTVNDKGEINSVLNMNVYGVVTDIGDKL